MKIAISQINPTIGDFEHNTQKILQFVAKAKDLACDLVVFSELVISGYPPRDLLEKIDFVETNLQVLQHLVNTIEGIGVILGYAALSPSEQGNPLVNAAVLFENGQILHQAHKRLLPTYDIFDERRYFEPGNTYQAFDYKGFRLGLTICEDTWNDKDIFLKRIYAIDPVDRLIQEGANLIVNIAASPFHVGKREFRWHMLSSIAKKYHVPLVFANQVGGNDGIIFDGTSAGYDSHGSRVASARDFEEDLVTFTIKTGTAYTGDKHPLAASANESILKALILGTRDYMRKCGFSRVVVGLSGGLDSALTAAIAVKALGPENVLGVFMPSRYTSLDNYEDTEQLARHLGIAYRQIPIDPIFREFVRAVSPNYQEGEPSVTEQNLQARTRGTILMAISNEEGRLLLSTGNKSELAVGYCTLYGDLTGGLAVISDVPKTIVYELAALINAEREYIPRRIMSKPPSAELKPGQTDQDDLPPYEQLDPILRGYIEDMRGKRELIEMGYDPELVSDVIARVDRNEYKRHQMAPGLKVTSKAFGYGRRYPIAQKYTW